MKRDKFAVTAMVLVILLATTVLAGTDIENYKRSWGAQLALPKCIGWVPDMFIAGKDVTIFTIDTDKNQDIWVIGEDIDKDTFVDIIWIVDAPVTNCPSRDCSQVLWNPRANATLPAGGHDVFIYRSYGGHVVDPPEWAEYSDIDNDGDYELILLVNIPDVAHKHIAMDMEDWDDDGDIDVIYILRMR